MGDSEAVLLREAMAGSTGAFEELALPLADGLYSVLAGMVGRAEAEDLLQETLMNAYRGIGNFRGDCSFRTWVSRIAMNAARTFLRKKRPQQANPGEDGDASGGDLFDCLASPGRGPVEELTVEEDREMVGAALNRLTPEEREVLVLREVDGFSYDEIAGALRITQASVRSRLHRARNRMLGLLGGRKRDAV
ncbi:MAG: sigma-70 family RNA polymerase sigma factor [Planctomycetes bacterium]|nr:sigma-70 family RNA polymerase sigma factor [Planctomycetota bacterium]